MNDRGQGGCHCETRKAMWQSIMREVSTLWIASPVARNDEMRQSILLIDQQMISEHLSYFQKEQS